jgi:hypothetical protein
LKVLKLEGKVFKKPSCVAMKGGRPGLSISKAEGLDSSILLNGKVSSEIEQHSKAYTEAEAGDKLAQDVANKDEKWSLAVDDESLDSFLARCQPSTSEVAWITTSHQGRKQLIMDYYQSAGGSGESKWTDEIEQAWKDCPEAEKDIEGMTKILQTHKYGGGKWMIFPKVDKVDDVWAKVVTALWEGKLGGSAKVSGKNSSGDSHVICVYGDPFWEIAEIERILHGLRIGCGVREAMKFKPDGVTMLGIYRDNPFGIPPSFYSSEFDGTSLTANSVGGWGGSSPRNNRGKQMGQKRWERGGGNNSRGGNNSSAGKDNWRNPRSSPKVKATNIAQVQGCEQY